MSNIHENKVKNFLLKIKHYDKKRDVKKIQYFIFSEFIKQENDLYVSHYKEIKETSFECAKYAHNFKLNNKIYKALTPGGDLFFTKIRFLKTENEKCLKCKDFIFCIANTLEHKIFNKNIINFILNKNYCKNMAKQNINIIENENYKVEILEILETYYVTF